MRQSCYWLLSSPGVTRINILFATIFREISRGYVSAISFIHRRSTPDVCAVLKRNVQLPGCGRGFDEAAARSFCDGRGRTVACHIAVRGDQSLWRNYSPEYACLAPGLWRGRLSSRSGFVERRDDCCQSSHHQQSDYLGYIRKTHW